MSQASSSDPSATIKTEELVPEFIIRSGLKTEDGRDLYVTCTDDYSTIHLKPRFNALDKHHLWRFDPVPEHPYTFKTGTKLIPAGATHKCIVSNKSGHHTNDNHLYLMEQQEATQYQDRAKFTSKYGRENEGGWHEIRSESQDIWWDVSRYTGDHYEDNGIALRGWDNWGWGNCWKIELAERGDYKIEIDFDQSVLNSVNLSPDMVILDEATNNTDFSFEKTLTATFEESSTWRMEHGWDIENTFEIGVSYKVGEAAVGGEVGFDIRDSFKVGAHGSYGKEQTHTTRYETSGTFKQELKGGDHVKITCTCNRKQVSLPFVAKITKTVYGKSEVTTVSGIFDKVLVTSTIWKGEVFDHSGKLRSVPVTHHKATRKQ